MSEGTDNKPTSLNRRGMLLGSTAVLAAATGLATRAQAQPAQGQAASSGRKPNILVIMGDDVGWSASRMTQRKPMWLIPVSICCA